MAWTNTNFYMDGGRSSVLNEYDRTIDERTFGSSQFTGNLSVGQSEVLIRIERFVNHVISSRQVAYLFKQTSQGRYQAIETPLGNRLRGIIQMLGLFDSYHDYSEHPCAFLHACWLMESVYGLDLNQMAMSHGLPDMRYAEALNSIVERIRMSAHEGWFLRGPSDRRWEANSREKVLTKYTTDLLRYYSRTMIVRVDLGYENEALGRLTIDQVYDHLDQLLYRKGWHPAFSALIGYSWSVEQGKDHGFHIHTAFYFDGSKVCRDVYKGFELGALWKSITNYQGIFENCNAHKERYTKLGIGMIYRNEAVACENAISAVTYLTKDSQYLRIKPRGRRVFGTGSTPDFESKRGRPPKCI